MARACIGLIVNPIAGMGGKVGLKGTDGKTIQDEAVARGAVPVAKDRARIALDAMAPRAAELELVTYGGDMGEAVARASGFDPDVIGAAAHEPSQAADTKAAARDMAARGARLILFAGGDGTARDVFEAVGQTVPMLGIPTGVKMHSAVFATGPASAGRLAADYVLGRERVELKDAEITDIDEDAQRRNRLSARLFGYVATPYQRLAMQHAKAMSRGGEDVELDALARAIAESMEHAVLYIVGPGGSTKRILGHLGLEGTLLGVDAVVNRDLVVRDASEADLLALLDGRPAEIISGVIGGQGFVFGRGNQQISAEVIRRTGRGNITIMAGADKLVALRSDRLLVDTGDAALDVELAGFTRVQTAPGQAMMLRLTPA